MASGDRREQSTMESAGRQQIAKRVGASRKARPLRSSDGNDLDEQHDVQGQVSAITPNPILQFQKQSSGCHIGH